MLRADRVGPGVTDDDPEAICVLELVGIALLVFFGGASVLAYNWTV